MEMGRAVRRGVNPSAKVLAVAQTEVNIGKIVEGMVQLYYVVSLGYHYYNFTHTIHSMRV